MTGPAHNDNDLLGVGTPEPEWLREIDEPVEIFVVHPNAAYAKTADELARWRGWFPATWTDFNGGGWVWHGLLGAVTHVRPVSGEDA
jgi:hypothetical protein